MSTSPPSRKRWPPRTWSRISCSLPCALHGRYCWYDFDLGFVEELARRSPVPVIAEGKSTHRAVPRRARLLRLCCVVGSAITRPVTIARAFCGRGRFGYTRRACRSSTLTSTSALPGADRRSDPRDDPHRRPRSGLHSASGQSIVREQRSRAWRCARPTPGRSGRPDRSPTRGSLVRRPRIERTLSHMIGFSEEIERQDADFKAARLRAVAARGAGLPVSG